MQLLRNPMLAALPLLAVGGALIALAGFVANSGDAKALTNCTIADSAVALDTQEQAFLGLINTYRAQNGRGSLTPLTSLNRAAAWHATDMVTKGYFSHNEPSGRTWSTRMTDCGYPTGGWRAENIAAGFSTAQSVFDAWKGSSGHNANMLNGNFSKIGIGKYGSYWTTDFGSVSDGTSGAAVLATSTPTRTPTSAAATATRTATNVAAPTRTPTRAASTATRTPTRMATVAATPSSQALTVSASASPSSMKASTSGGVSVVVRSSTSRTAKVVVEVVNPSGSTVKKTTWSNAWLAAYASRTFQLSWTTPSTWSTGTYRVKVTVTGAIGWPTLYSNSNAATFTVIR